MTSQAGNNVAKLRGTLNGPAPGGQLISDFTLNYATSGQEIYFANTNPNGWSAGAGRMTLDCQFTLNNFLNSNPSAHIFISLRQPASQVGLSIQGQGVAMGALGSFTSYSPTPLSETFYAGGNHVYGNSHIAASSVLADGNTYRLIVESTLAIDGNRYLRHRLWQLDGANNYWKALSDSGDILDYNPTIDMTQSGFLVGYVFAGTSTTWSVPFTNVKTTWGPAYATTGDQTLKLGIYGGNVAGPLNFTGSASKIGVVTPSTSDYSTATAFQATTSNLNTSVIAKPNGSATGSNFLSLSSSNPSTNYYAAAYGVSGNVANLFTFGVGSGYTAPDFSVQIGIGNEVLRVKSDRVNIMQMLAFPNLGSTITVYNDSSLNYSNFTGVQTSLANSPTSLVFKPNGSATSAGIVAVNSSTPTGTYGAAAFNISGPKAQVVTYSVVSGVSGGAAPNFSVQIGVGNEVALFSTSGITLLGASSPIGSPINLASGITGMGGSNAMGLVGSSSGQVLNIDNICAPGYLASQYGASYSAAVLEGWTRPLWALVSVLYEDYLKKKLG